MTLDFALKQVNERNWDLEFGRLLSISSNIH